MSRILETHRKFVRSTRANPALSFGTTMAAGFGFLGWAGWKLDQHFKTEPLFILIGVGLAFSYSGYELWKLLRETASSAIDKIEDPGSTPPPSP